MKKTRRMFRTIISMILIVGMLGASCVFADSSETIYDKNISMQLVEDVVDTIRIDVQGIRNEKMNKGISNEELINRMFSSEETTAFFKKNKMDVDYYKSVLEKDLSKLREVKFVVTKGVEEDHGKGLTYSPDIQGSRLVYADAVYELSTQRFNFTVGELVKNAVLELLNVVSDGGFSIALTVANVLGLDNLEALFHSDLVRLNKEYAKVERTSRYVTKFVELYAPVNGTLMWYPWGYAQSEYVNNTVMFYYKGLKYDEAPAFSQHYTQRYYSHTDLINKVKSVYPNGTWNEVADYYGSLLGGYTIYNYTSITASKYLEYDSLCP